MQGDEREREATRLKRNVVVLLVVCATGVIVMLAITALLWESGPKPP